MQQIPLPIAPAAAPSFEGFVAGDNDQALQHLRSLVQRDAASAPVFLWGPPGSGKTHLLQALAAAWRSGARGAASFDAATSTPWAIDDGVSLVVIDDCHALDARRQHAAFALFVDAVGCGAQVAAAGRVPPVDLPLRDDLRTRLGWGPVFALRPLADDALRAALQRQARERGIRVGDDVLDYLLTRCARDMGRLMPLFERLDRLAWVEKRSGITLPLLKRVLADEEPTR